jgi:hypothetical protein
LEQKIAKSTTFLGRVANKVLQEAPVVVDSTVGAAG